VGQAVTSPLILLVDDSDDIRDLYMLYLSSIGLRVDGASNAVGGIARAFAIGPDLIVMDLNMPGMTGIEAIERLKTDARTRCIPIIVLTADTRPETRRAVLDACGDSFVTKPCLPPALAAEIRRVLQRAS
jgi:CheY-like chemotaxis protein